jgi:3-hydroxybutyryl-CoA dehydratase
MHRIRSGFIKKGDKMTEKTSKLPLKIDQKFDFSKTITEPDFWAFSAISGDFSPQHVDEESMKPTKFGRRIAHGGLMVALISSVAAAAAIESQRNIDAVAVSIGYDRIRFLAPVFIGDTIKVTYTVASIDEERLSSTANVTMRNQHGKLVAKAQHLMQWI